MLFISYIFVREPEQQFRAGAALHQQGWPAAAQAGQTPEHALLQKRMLQIIAGYFLTMLWSCSSVT